jgi:hypothetical protein
MALTPAQLAWYYTNRGLARDVSSNPASLGGMVATTRIPAGSLHNVFVGIGGLLNKAGVTDYRCIAIVNTGTLSLSSIKLFLQKIDTRGSTLSVGLDPVGIVTNLTTTPVAQEVAGGQTAPAGVTFTVPTSAAPINVTGSLGPNSGFAVWLRRVTSSVAGVNPETNIIAVSGTSPI